MFLNVILFLFLVIGIIGVLVGVFMGALFFRGFPMNSTQNLNGKIHYVSYVFKGQNCWYIVISKTGSSREIIYHTRGEILKEGFCGSKYFVPFDDFKPGYYYFLVQPQTSENVVFRLIQTI